MNKKLPATLKIERAETQAGVNETILTWFYNRYNSLQQFSVLDVPCGNAEFLIYLKQLFPNANLTGGDINITINAKDINLIQMDLTEDFPLPINNQFDIVTSISGIMMFSNTLRFIKNCSAKLKKDGVFIITNDNQATIKDRLSYMFLGRYRIFNLLFEDDQPMTENVPVNELVRLLRTNGIEIEDIAYTSVYKKDLIYLPLAWIIYLFQYVYLKRLNTKLPELLKWKMYPFKHLLARHYIVYGRKYGI